MAKRAESVTLGYLRVSTASQAESMAGLDAQRASIEQYARNHGLTIDRWLTDAGISASIAPLKRPALGEALAILAKCGSGGVLLIAKGDRVARKTSDLLALRDLTERQGWTLIASDGSVDWSTSHGRAMSTVMSAFSELERDLIRTRTREGLAAKKSQGVRLGRPSNIPTDVRERISAERMHGRSVQKIADGLTRDAVPTGSVLGTRWHRSTVRTVLRSIALDELADANRAAYSEA